MAISVTQTVSALNILICSRGFLDCLHLESFKAKCIDVRSACSGCTCVKVSYFGHACIRSACAKIVCSRNASVKSAGTNSVYILGTCVKRACTGTTCANDTCTKGTDTKSILIKNVYNRITYSGSASIRANIYISHTYIKADTCICNACIRNVGINVPGIIGTCVGKAGTGGVYTSNTCTKSADAKNICRLVQKPSKFFIESLKLLI